MVVEPPYPSGNSSLGQYFHLNMIMHLSVILGSQYSLNLFSLFNKCKKKN